MKTLAQRLDFAMRKVPISQSELARKINLSQTAVQKIISGKTATSRKIGEIAEILGVSVNWLLKGEDVSFDVVEESDEYCRVDILDIEAIANNQAVTNDSLTKTVSSIKYTEAEAISIFGRRPADTIKIVTVKGDGMIETLKPRDLIFVDVSIKKFEGDGIYLFIYNDHLYVKRLQLKKDEMRVISDNKVYVAWSIEKEEFESMLIVAKVLVCQPFSYKILA